MSDGFAVILVDSTSHAIQIEKRVTLQGLACKLIPVPRHLSSDCGVCVRIARDEIEKIKILLINRANSPGCSAYILRNQSRIFCGPIQSAMIITIEKPAVGVKKGRNMRQSHDWVRSIENR